jgi:hypothetical protein
MNERRNRGDSSNMMVQAVHQCGESAEPLLIPKATGDGDQAGDKKDWEAFISP